MDELELWGGHECTVNSVHSAFHDQTRRSGHHDRPEDLDRFAALGLRTLRYPVLWERVAPEAPGQRDWSWTDARLQRLRALGVRPVVGLLHHGSGPRYTSLEQPGFAGLFADYARAVAERYPWVEDWTPVNEPLTTARFATLYGLWRPHLRDERAFWTALLNQIEATRLGMREIRKVNPRARLIQTEDLGQTYGTRAIAHQVEFDNHRRWMTWDLLEGRVTSEHPLYARLVGFGLENALARIADEPCPADVVGVNHYLTSDRFLDHRFADYPRTRLGGNEFMAFADVEAVRVALPAPGGLEGVLGEAWSRYGRPLAVTELHNGCTREEQVRWLRDGWETAQRLRRSGVDVRAVTAWALLGSHDWNSLLTRTLDHYEPGAFDVRSDPPALTALGVEIARLASGRGAAHPATLGDGWWRRDVRLQYRPVFRTPDTPEPRPSWRPAAGEGPSLLIAGATGTLGKALARACEWRGVAYRLATRAELPLDRPDALRARLDEAQPWAVINAAGWVRVDDAEADEAGCFAANAAGAIDLARACAERGLGYVGYSSDLVFDGTRARPYVESDPPAPLNAYGRSKAVAERGVLELGGQALMIRTAAFFSAFDPHNFAAHVVRTLSGDQRLSAAEDLIISPTYVPDLVDASLDLLIDGQTGLRHLANTGAVTWAAFARQLATALDLDPGLIDPTPSARFGWPAPRPAFAALGSEKGVIMPTLDNAIARYAALARRAEFAGDAEALVDSGRPVSPVSSQ